MAKYKKHVEVVPVDYKYSFGNQSDAKTHRIQCRNTFLLGIDWGVQHEHEDRNLACR